MTFPSMDCGMREEEGRWITNSPKSLVTAFTHFDVFLKPVWHLMATVAPLRTYQHENIKTYNTHRHTHTHIYIHRERERVPETRVLQRREPVMTTEESLCFPYRSHSSQPFLFCSKTCLQLRMLR